MLVAMQAMNARLAESGMLSPHAMGKRDWPKPAGGQILHYNVFGPDLGMMINWMRTAQQGPQATPPMVKAAQQWQKSALVNPAGEPLLFSRPIARDSFLGGTVLPLYQEVSGAYTKVWKEATKMGKAGLDPLAFAGTKIFNESVKHLQDDAGNIWAWLRKAVNGITGFLDGLTFGLFSKVLKVASNLLNVATFGASGALGLTYDNIIDKESTAYKAGYFAGEVAQIILTVAMPGGAVGLALRGAMMAGGVANSVEAIANGDILGGISGLAQTALGFVAGRSACKMGSLFGKWGGVFGARAGKIATLVGKTLTKAVYWGETAYGIYDTADAIAAGDWRRAALGLGRAVAGRYQASKACYEASTHLNWTETASKPVEDFKDYETYGDDCDRIITRSELDPNAPLEYKRVLRKFKRFAPILNLHARGRTIGTTAEHPHYVEGKGWLPAALIEAGDIFHSRDGQRLLCEGIADSGRWAEVYNLEVEDCHTYFVGDARWGWSIWAHNQYEVLARRGLKPKNVKSSDGKSSTPVYGTAQTTNGPNSKNHVKKINKKVQEMVDSGEYEYIVMNRSWHTSTSLPRTSARNKRPDIIGVRKDGKVEAFEVASPRDKDRVLLKKLRRAMNSLPASDRGWFDVL